MTLYNLRQSKDGFTITKFDADLNVESSYLMTVNYLNIWSCSCPASHRKTCRHREMAPIMIDRVNTGWFYNFDTKLWVDPTGTAEEAS